MKTNINWALSYLLIIVLLTASMAGCGSAGKEAGKIAVSATPTLAATPTTPASSASPAATVDTSGSGSTDKNADNIMASATPTSSATPAPSVTPASSATPTAIADAANNGNVNGNPTSPLPDSGDGAKSPTSLEVASLMGNGINLGNTMEAYGRDSLGVGASVSAYETFWGQPVTTREIIHSMKAAGFDSLRIPVAWTNTMDFKKGDYTIGKDYLNRVGEIINYALDEGMYAVVNDHWDGGWWGMFGSASQETRDNAMKMYVAMWTQIAEKYRDYSNRLIFESANEELGNRLNDNNLCKDSGTLSENECYKTANKINQAFVDTVRSTGGNNAQRFLLIAGYNTDIDKTCDNRFVIPTDKAKDKLLLSVHYYTPWGYCGATSLSKWGTKKEYTEQNDLLAKMTKFTKKGYGVILGEYSVALNSDGSVKNNTSEFFNNFLNNCDRYGYAPMLWDCSSLFVRKNLGFIDDNVAKVFKSRSLAAQSNMTEDKKAAAAKTAMDKAFAAAPDSSNPAVSENGNQKAVAWIMFNSSDYGTTYSVGDVYDPSSKSEGVVATDVNITGKGTYTASLDFTGTGTGYANSFAFSALGISNGEILFPDYVVILIDVKINGESCKLTGKPYTAADDSICTRVNLYNEWVKTIPAGVRTVDGSTIGVSAILLNPKAYAEIKTLTVTFKYVPRSDLVH